ncbi:MAG: cytochrome P450 [Burkholderiaceae bacterium]
MTPIASLIRVILQGDGNLLGLLPANAYHNMVGRLGYSRRDILVVNDPALARRVLTDADGIFPKNDLMVSALDPLVGESIFVSSGEQWRRQRDMIDPALSMMRINRAFGSMVLAVDDYQERLDRQAASQESFSLDLTMSHLTADIICRSVFTTSLKSQIAKEVFESFTVFERSVAQVELRRLIFEPAFTPVKQHQDVLNACERIRRHLGQLVDSHLASNDADLGAASHAFNDIASAIIEARSPVDNAAFTRKELIDQLGVFFLAGHETTASVLTWVFYILATRPDVTRRIREEVKQVAGDGPIEFEQIRDLTFVRNVFRETLRLYPPITFIPRVAMEKTKLGKLTAKRGAMIMVSPWTIHRHRKLWKTPEMFDPDRFSPAREGELTAGAYLPFGVGPRVCAGASFANVESALIIARLARRYDFSAVDADKVQPVARLTTRPSRQIMIKVSRAFGA